MLAYSTDFTGEPSSAGALLMEPKFFELDQKMEDLRQQQARFSNGIFWIVENFQEKLDLSWIYHDHALEGVVLSYSELKAAIDKKIISDVTLIPMYEEIKNHKAAIEFIRELAKKRKITITIDLLRKL